MPPHPLPPLPPAQIINTLIKQNGDPPKGAPAPDPSALYCDHGRLAFSRNWQERTPPLHPDPLRGRAHSRTHGSGRWCPLGPKGNQWGRERLPFINMGRHQSRTTYQFNHSRTEAQTNCKQQTNNAKQKQHQQHNNETGHTRVTYSQCEVARAAHSGPSGPRFGGCAGAAMGSQATAVHCTSRRGPLQERRILHEFFKATSVPWGLLCKAIKQPTGVCKTSNGTKPAKCYSEFQM